MAHVHGSMHVHDIFLIHVSLLPVLHMHMATIEGLRSKVV